MHQKCEETVALNLPLFGNNTIRLDGLGLLRLMHAPSFYSSHSYTVHRGVSRLEDCFGKEKKDDQKKTERSQVWPGPIVVSVHRKIKKNRPKIGDFHQNRHYE